MMSFHFLNSRRFFWALTALVLMLSLATTYGAWQLSVKNLNRERQVYFDFRVRQLLDRIQERVANYEHILYGARGLFIASGEVERAEFSDYVAALELDTHYPGIQGVGFALLIPAIDRIKHIASMYQQGFPDYSIRPEGDRDVYSSVIYLEPFSGRNLRAFGYDMFSEPVRRQAMIYAYENNKIGISGKVTLVQETDQDIQAGFLIYLPVYQKGLPNDSAEERRAHLMGWIYAPFRFKDFFAGIGGERSEDLHLEVFDSDQVNETTRMYGSPTAGEKDQIFSSTQTIRLSDHQWTVLIHTTDSFQLRIDRTLPQFILITGLITSILLSLLTWVLLSSRKRALVLAEKMTAGLRESEMRFRVMADSAPVLIWISGLDKLCFWFNQVWLRFTGRTLVQEIGNGWAEGVHADDLQGCLDVYIQHFDSRKPFTMEYRLKRYDGEYRWILDNGIPRYDDTGHFAGYIGSCIDITDRKRLQSALETRNKVLNRFALVSAHHLMEPARRFTSYTQRLRKGLSAFSAIVNDEDISFCLKALERDALTMRTLVLDIQRYLAAGEPRGEVKNLDSNVVVRDIEKKLMPNIRAANAEIIVEDLPSARLDSPRFIDLWTVLVENALRYGQPQDRNTRLSIHIRGERQDTTSRFYISDNGPGIPAQYVLRVFEVFERLGPRTDDSGTGIGLAIAQRIIESRFGKIWIDTSLQGGTCVVFELPDGEKHDP